MDELALSNQAISEFDEIYNKCISTGVIRHLTYTSKYPLFMFLNYVIENKNVLVHGSNNHDITHFEPRDSSLFKGQPINAVFASSDGVWSLFFAVKNREEHMSVRNLCLTMPTKKGKKRYYYFSRHDDEATSIWRDGAIYMFSKDKFKQGGIRDMGL
ncbi:hypothetical protein [Ornithinibacillus scapharcae]|uniref:hypothetical protein n=1 Tax=Ornithinibacillus scapharcae TaxID=1147159 RepID=UPI000225AB62|nr:hypothetical protein [Ornithinibacillus scapharcae]